MIEARAIIPNIESTKKKVESIGGNFEAYVFILM